MFCGAKREKSPWRQTTILEFHSIRYQYIPMRRSYPQRRGLAERQLKQRLEGQGWLVWRAASIALLRQTEVFPNVRRHYSKLIHLLEQERPGFAELLAYWAAVHHGLPDFLCYRAGAFLFVECKLGHEQLSALQKRCIQRLEVLGWTVEVHKLVEPCTKVRDAFIDFTGRKHIMERQLTLRQAARV